MEHKPDEFDDLMRPEDSIPESDVKCDHNYEFSHRTGRSGEIYVCTKCKAEHYHNFNYANTLSYKDRK
jgi:hypothetical protein